MGQSAYWDHASLGAPTTPLWVCGATSCGGSRPSDSVLSRSEGLDHAKGRPQVSWLRPIWRIREWWTWHLPERWSDGGRRGSVVRWMRRCCSPQTWPDLTIQVSPSKWNISNHQTNVLSFLQSSKSNSNIILLSTYCNSLFCQQYDVTTVVSRPWTQAADSRQNFNISVNSRSVGSAPLFSPNPHWLGWFHLM